MVQNAGPRAVAGERFLAAGEMRQLQSEARSAGDDWKPALQHAFYETSPHIGAYGMYDWQFLAKDVLPNVNVMISSGSPDPRHIREWKAGGRQWISIIGLPPVKADEAGAAEKAFQYWSNSPGYQDPQMSGIIVDEFGGGDDPLYDVYRRAVQRLNAAFPGKAYLPYGGIFYGKDRSREFAKAALAGGGYLCREHYLPEQPTQELAQQLITQTLAGEAAEWEAGLPGVIPRLIYVLGYMSQPNESLNINPAVNYRVFMDMQIRMLATHPALFGLGGIQEYHIAYCDEENARWAGRLYRHYCIEGNTAPATRFAPDVCGLAIGAEAVTIAFAPSWALVGSGLLASAAVGLLAGLAPAWQASRADIVRSLRQV